MRSGVEIKPTLRERERGDRVVVSSLELDHLAPCLQVKHLNSPRLSSNSGEVKSRMRLNYIGLLLDIAQILFSGDLHCVSDLPCHVIEAAKESS